MKRSNTSPISFFEAASPGDADILIRNYTSKVSAPSNLRCNSFRNRASRHIYAPSRMLSLPLQPGTQTDTCCKSKPVSNKSASTLPECDLTKDYGNFSLLKPSILSELLETEMNSSLPNLAASSTIEFLQQSNPMLKVSPCRSISTFSPLLDTNVERRALTKNSRIECDELRHYRPSKWGNAQIIIDIDDTILSSGGLKLFNFNIGGIDQQYKRGELYPGSAQFVFELAIHELSTDEQPLSVAVLTARIPQVPVRFDSPINQKLITTAKRSGIKNWGIDCDRKVMYSTLNEWFFQEAKATRKYENFLTIYQQMTAIHGNMLYIWIGDTGEMDEEVGEMMANAFPENIKTYVDAARKACKYGLLSEFNATRVIVQAIRDLDALKVASFSTKWLDLLRDWQKSEALFNFRDSSIPIIRDAFKIVRRHQQEFSKCLKIRTKIAASQSAIPKRTSD
ncbi:hypothetical protein IE077_004015 [Cardiosporidium cionae]|uniref:Uncharacterized protein n=1 Tax=Cardiosporidium cionae TaxID=476202 RepID=A0ABQ7J710_9APIC|nr:hypothetical protein IE077_004015 [Cardiosporidium cionae]|eukprot:KAF8819778.1 hypothetical protein IE077_004015 [Cardiosporidium cionae]